MPERIDLTLDPIIREISRTADLLDKRGFGPSFFGNISVLIRGIPLPEEGREYPLALPFPDLVGSVLYITRTTSTMRGIASDPSSNVGVYRIERDHIRTIAGAGPPSTELLSHLSIHSKLALPASAVVHCHIGELLALVERIDPLPAWIRSVPELREGSIELARGTGEAADLDTVILWRGHGIVAAAKTLQEAYGLIEKAADIAAKGLRAQADRTDLRS
jgi:ribulose-5-phosphate 4-epimerase/fuculose-1-phosphate aldolase